VRVLQLIQKPQLRGAENFACQLATELTANNVQVDIAYLFPGPHVLEERYPALKFIPVGGNIHRRFFDLRGYRAISRIVAAGHYDLVQANAGDTLKYAIFSKWIFRWKTPIVFRNANQMSLFLKTPLQRYYNKLLLRKVDYVISVSENCRRDIIRIKPSLGIKSKTITIGTYTFEHVPAFPRNETGPVVINIGSFVPEKNHAFLIRVFKQCHDLNKNARLWLIGDGPLRTELQELTDRLGLSEAVNFFGYRQDAVSILKSADIMVLPSSIEGLPGVILEAFACGVPVIASATGGIPEVVMDGTTGICIKSSSIDEFARGIDRLLQPGFRRKVVREAKAIVNRKYLMDSIAMEFLNTYKAILKA
jgi:L-malate glycosyltransferase